MPKLADTKDVFRLFADASVGGLMPWQNVFFEKVYEGFKSGNSTLGLNAYKEFSDRLEYLKVSDLRDTIKVMGLGGKHLRVIAKDDALSILKVIHWSIAYNICQKDKILDGAILERVQKSLRKADTAEEVHIFWSAWREQIDKDECYIVGLRAKDIYVALAGRNFFTKPDPIPVLNEPSEPQIEPTIEQLTNLYANNNQEPPTMEPEPMTTSNQIASAQAPDAQQALQILINAMQPKVEINEDRVKEMIDDAISARVPRKVTIKAPTATNPVTIDHQHKNFIKLVKLCELRHNVMLTGEAGSGKTTAAIDAAKVLELKSYVMSMNEEIGRHQIEGYTDANGNFVDTPLYKAFKYGGVLCVDEFDRSNENGATVLNALSANDQYTFPNGENVSRHEDFILIATGNTYGRGADGVYVGANQLDGATLDRFTQLEWDIDDKFEESIAEDHEWMRKVQATRKAVQSFNGQIKLVVSMRATIKGAQMLSAGFKEKEVFESLIYKGLDQNSIGKVQKKVEEILGG
jgi:hypothetical protein